MVLESIANPLRAERKPWELFLVGLLYASAALFLSNWIFKEHASLIMVFLTAMASIPLIYNTIKIEEKKDSMLDTESKRLKEHSKALLFLCFLFMGFVVAFVLWYIILPASFVQNTFYTQTLTIRSINTKVTGDFQGIKTFTIILLNNIKVLIFCILFSFLYGAGAIFILSWNASVIATAIGNFVRLNLETASTKIGLMKWASYFHIVSLGLLRYALHGIPEIAAYFIAGLAGGIISVAVIKESFGTRKFENIILDSSDLILISVGVLIIAAIFEVYLTPLLFY
jgi:uncharacterized membrane protein SpoIIM required for sporulation